MTNGKRHLLVTGGCGFMGSNFVRHALKQQPTWRVTNLDALTYAGNLHNLDDVDAAYPHRYRFVHGNILDRHTIGRLLADASIDAVVHLAAESHVDRSIADACPFVRTNVLGTEMLLEAAREAGRPIRFVHGSTDEVYGSLPLQPPDACFTEQSPLEPNNPYAASKAAADMLVRSYHRTYGLDVVVTRSCNVFGPHQFPEKVIPLFITNLLRGRRVPLYGDGRHVREWFYVDDFCEALMLVLQRGESGEAYNLGSDTQKSNLELTRTILEIMEEDEAMIEYVADRPGHDLRYHLCTDKARSQLGFEPRADGRDALQRTVRWYRDHEDWWRRILNGEHRASIVSR